MRGGGPGEYRTANGVVFGPDGLLRVPDMRNARLSRVHLDSGYVGSHPFHPSYAEYTWSGVVDSAGRAWSVYYLRGNGEGDPRYRLIRWRPPADTALILDVERTPVPTDMAAADSITRGYEERFGTSLDRSKVPETAPAHHPRRHRLGRGPRRDGRAVRGAGAAGGGGGGAMRP